MEDTKMNTQNNQYPLGGYNQNQYQQQGMSVGNQQCMSNQRKPIMDIVALVIGILSVLTCSGCFVLGITGLVLSIIVLVDNSGKYVKKTKAIVAMVLSIISILMLIIAITFGSFTATTVDNSKPTVSSSQANEEDTEHTSVGGITGFYSDSGSEVSEWDSTKTLDDNINSTTEESDYYKAISNAEYNIRFDLIKQEGEVNDIKVNYDKAKLGIQEWKVKEVKYDSVSYLYGGQGSYCYQYYAKIPAGTYAIKTDVEYLQNVDIVKNEFYKLYNGGDFIFNKTGISENARYDENTYTIDAIKDSELVTIDSSIIISTKYESTQKEDIKDAEENYKFITVTDDDLINIELYGGYSAEDGTITLYRVQ